MKYKGLLFAILGLGLLTGCASEQSKNQRVVASVGESKQSPPNNLSEDTNNRLICKSRAITGSRFKQKTCMTAEEWERMSRESTDMVKSQGRKGVLGNPEGG